MAKTDTATKNLPAINNQVNEFDILEAIKLKTINNHSYQEIADYYGMPKPTVYKKIQALINMIGDPQVTEAFKAKRINILTNIERVMSENLINEDKLKGASLNNIAYAFNQVHTARRLEEEKATSIVKPLVSFGTEPIDVTPVEKPED